MSAFITIKHQEAAPETEQVLSLSKTLDILRRSGSLTRLLTEIKQQYFLEEEMQKQNISVNQNDISRTVAMFLGQRFLVSQDRIDDWLKNNYITYQELESQIEFGLKVDKLKEKVTEPLLKPYFEQHKNSLQEIILSRIVIEFKKEADEVKDKLE